MARKVFLSILGTGFYGEGVYFDAGTSFESTQTRFIQEATLRYLNAEQWSENDSIIIVLTDKAREQNWNVTDNKRLNNTKQEETYIGLKDKLALLKLPVSPIELSIPDGKDESEMWQIFTSIYEQLQQGDELYIDLTHSFRYLPMLLLVLVDYARFLKDINVKSLTYGNWEARDKSTNRAPIVNLMPLIALQNWTSAATELIINGNAGSLNTVALGDLIPLLSKIETRTKDNINIRKATENMAEFVSEIRLCRGLNVTDASHYRIFAEYIEKVTGSGFAPLNPILDKIKEQFERLSFSTEKNSVSNQYSAARWCAEMQMWQTAITLLQEGVLSKIFDIAGLNIENRKTRELVSNFLNTLSEKKVKESKSKKEKKAKSDIYTGQLVLRKIYQVGILHNGTLPEWFGKLGEFRNDFNHAGMREGATKDIKKFQDKVNQFITQAEYIFDEQPQQIEDCEVSANIFVNLSNHPSDKWSEEQLQAAEQFGTVEDMPFPDINADADDEAISAIAQEYADRLFEKARTANVSVHVMGEMTFTHALVNKLEYIGIPCFASTTERETVDNEDGTKTSRFRFKKFRRY